MIVEILKQQHRDTLRIAEKIEDTFDGGTIESPHLLRSLLSLFIGKLAVHIDMERTCLGNKLKDAGKKDLCAKHEQEMVAFCEQFKAYRQKWSAASSIDEEQQNFIEDSRKLFSYLKRMIEAQERDMCANF